MDSGLTLIELLVAISIFGIVMVAVLGLFTSAFKSQREVLQSTYILNSSSYVTDYLSRSLRMAKKDIEGDCIDSKGNYEHPGGDISSIRFLNYNNHCQQFSLEGDKLKVKKSSDSTEGNLGVGIPITPSNLEFENLEFKIIGETQEDEVQPRVTFKFRLIPQGGEEAIREFELQSTVSQRELDVKY